MAHRYRVGEIAQQAGLSEATVDRVLHNRANVRESTRPGAAAVHQGVRRGRSEQWQIVVSDRPMRKVLRRSSLSMLRSAMIPPITGDHAECDVGEHGLMLGEPRFLQHPRAVVHDRVDAGELLGHADADAD